jgi:hypothetical protein
VLRWCVRLAVTVGNRNMLRSVQTHTIVFLNIHRLCSSAHRPRILDINLIVSGWKLLAREVSKANPVTEIFLSDCSRSSNLATEHLRHYFLRLATRWVHPWIVSVRRHKDVHSFSSRKLKFLERSVVILIPIIARFPVLLVHSHDEVKECIFESLQVHEEHAIVQIAIRDLFSVIDANARCPPGIVVIPLSDVLFLTPWVA